MHGYRKTFNCSGSIAPSVSIFLGKPKPSVLERKGTTVGMPNKAAAAANTLCDEAQTLESADEFVTRRTWQRAHAAMVTRCMPMNSKGSGPPP